MFGRIIGMAAAVSAPLALAVTVLAPAHAAPPPSKTVKWVDPANDQVTLVLAGADPTVDILASQITGSRAAIDTVTTMAQVSTAPPLTGDGLVVETFFTYNDHVFYLVSQRALLGDSFTLEYLDTSATPHTYHKLACDTCKGAFDSVKNTISFHAAVSSINGALAAEKLPPIGKKAKLTSLETDSLIVRGSPTGSPALLSVADTSQPSDPHAALVIP